MSALSIRKLPEDLDKAIRRTAKEQGKTKSEIVIQALRRGMGLPKGSVAERRAKLRQFFGKMSTAEYQSFRKATQIFEEVDEDLWR